MNIVENMRLTIINAKIRNFKNETILNFLIDFLIESGPDLLRNDDPARIAIDLGNRSAWPEPGRAGPVKNIRPEPGQAAGIRPGQVDTSSIHTFLLYNYN